MTDREKFKALLPVITEYANGGAIQFFQVITGEWHDLPNDPQFNLDPTRYRIKPKPPEPKYRPYTPEEAKSLCGRTIQNSQGEPYVILAVSNSGIVLVGHMWASPQELLGYNWTIDGKPFAAEV